MKMIFLTRRRGFGTKTNTSKRARSFLRTVLRRKHGSSQKEHGSNLIMQVSSSREHSLTPSVRFVPFWLDPCLLVSTLPPRFGRASDDPPTAFFSIRATPALDRRPDRASPAWDGCPPAHSAGSHGFVST